MNIKINIHVRILLFVVTAELMTNGFGTGLLWYQWTSDHCENVICFLSILFLFFCWCCCSFPFSYMTQILWFISTVRFEFILVSFQWNTSKNGNLVQTQCCVSLADALYIHDIESLGKRPLVNDSVQGWCIRWHKIVPDYQKNDTSRSINVLLEQHWNHDDVTNFPRYCPFVQGIDRSPVNDAELWCFLWSAHWINGWVNNREAGDLRRHCANYDVIVMI